MAKSVALFLSDLQNGGTEWFAIHLARGLRAKGYEPYFILARRAGDLLSIVQKEFPLIALGGSGYTPAGIFRCVPELMRVLRANKPDALICGLPLINAAAAFAKAWMGLQTTKLIVVEHIRLSAEATQSFWLKQFMKEQMVFATHRAADHVVCVSKTVLCDLDKIYTPAEPPQVHLIYNPVIPPDFEALCLTRVDHPWLRQTGERQKDLIVSIGRLLENKDYPTLLNAFQQVRLQRPTLRLIILGEGCDRSRLEDMIRELGLQNAVSLPGAVPNIFPYLKEAALFVLPSQAEAFGNVLVEALACGTPVVSTDCGGPREILQEGDYGDLVPIGHVDAMARAISQSLATEVDRERLANFGQSFSVEKATEAYIKLIEK